MYGTASVIDNQDYYDENDDIINNEDGNYYGECFYEDGTSSGENLEDYQVPEMLSIHRGFRTSRVDNMFSKTNRSSSVLPTSNEPSVLSIISNSNTKHGEENIVECKSQKKWGSVNKNIKASIDYKSYPILGYTPPSFKDGFTQVLYKKTTRVSTPQVPTRIITRADMPKLVRQIGI
jgi:hypothetical protein